MDTICVMAIPMDMFICPPEKDSIYCYPWDSLQYDENGNPHPSITGVPSYVDNLTMDTVPIWPQPPKVCEIVVEYKDWDFSPNCPRVVKRQWYVKNLCTGDYMTCDQWLMIFDTIKPVITELDTMSVIAYTDDPHDCFVHYKVPWIRGADTCTGIKMVKAGIEPYGRVVLNYNAEKDYWETNKTIKVPVTRISDEDPDCIIYEFIDSCHNQTNDTVPFVIIDNTPPVPVCDGGFNVTLTDSTVWVPAHVFDEGSRDDCEVEFLWARRADWHNSCGVDLCDDLIALCTTTHDDTLWFPTLESNPHKNEIEAHYAETIQWLCEDNKSCSFWLLFGWWYDLLKYGTIDCIEHPYPIDDQYFYDLLFNSDCEILDPLCSNDFESFETDIIKSDSFLSIKYFSFARKSQN